MHRALALLSLVALTACAEAPPPSRTAEYAAAQGPSGSILRTFTCEGSVSLCFARAANLCPEGYDVEEATPPTRTHLRRYGRGFAVDLPGTLAVTCARDRPGALARCEDAWEQRGVLARWWSERRGGAPRRDVPEETFRHACGALSATAQRCLVAKYRAHHPDRCDEAVDDLGAVDVAMLDLALVAPAPK